MLQIRFTLVEQLFYEVFAHVIVISLLLLSHLMSTVISFPSHTHVFFSLTSSPFSSYLDVGVPSRPTGLASRPATGSARDTNTRPLVAGSRDGARPPVGSREVVVRPPPGAIARPHSGGASARDLRRPGSASSVIEEAREQVQCAAPRQASASKPAKTHHLAPKAGLGLDEPGSSSRALSAEEIKIKQSFAAPMARLESERREVFANLQSVALQKQKLLARMSDSVAQRDRLIQQALQEDEEFERQCAALKAEFEADMARVNAEAQAEALVLAAKNERALKKNVCTIAPAEDTAKTSAVAAEPAAATRTTARRTTRQMSSYGAGAEE